MTALYSIEADILKREHLPLGMIAGRRMGKRFYLQNCLRVAKELIGKVLVRRTAKGIYAGLIVETEAYLGDKDPASHSFRGKTPRNSVMFGPGGHCYVYFTYGNHYCMNVVTREKDVAHAVLIRAIEPVKGIRRMKKNRRVKDILELANGPGKLTEAIEIDKETNGSDFFRGSFYIADSKLPEVKRIKCSKRIGITKNADRLWRFYADENPFVSRVRVKEILKKLSANR